MQPILGLIEHHRLRAVDHFRRHLLAAVGGQAVHEDGLGPRKPHKPGIDLIGLEQIVTAGCIGIMH